MGQHSHRETQPPSGVPASISLNVSLISSPHITTNPAQPHEHYRLPVPSSPFPPLNWLLPLCFPGGGTSTTPVTLLTFPLNPTPLLIAHTLTLPGREVDLRRNHGQPPSTLLLPSSNSPSVPSCHHLIHSPRDTQCDPALATPLITTLPRSPLLVNCPCGRQSHFPAKQI